MHRNRSLHAIVVAELVSLTGTAMTFVALPWFVLSTTGSTSRMGMVLAAEMLPIGLLGIPAGSLIARLGAKRAMQVSDAARAPLMTIVPVLHWTGHLAFPALLAAALLVGSFTVPYTASSRLILPEVLGDDEQLVAAGSAWVGTGSQVAQIGGPVLGGLLIAAAGPTAVLAVDAGTYLFSLLTISLFVRGGRRVEQTDESRGLLAGLRFLLRDPLLGPLAIVACFVNFAAQGLIVAMPVLAFRRFAHSSVTAGGLFAALGAGALAGGLVTGVLARRANLLRLAVLGILGMSAPLWVLALTLPAYGVAAVCAGFGFFASLVNAPVFGTLTARTPQALRPKVLTALFTVATLAGPLGFVTAGEALQAVSLRVVFLAVAASFTASAVAFAWVVHRNGGRPAATAETAGAFPALTGESRPGAS